MHVPKAGDLLKVGQMEFEVLWPEERVGGEGWWNKAIKDDINVSDYTDKKVGIADLNGVSVVVKVSFGRVEALLTGDISSLQTA